MFDVRSNWQAANLVYRTADRKHVILIATNEIVYEIVSNTQSFHCLD